MTDIILSTQNGEPVVSSRQIAESFGKEHRNVMRDIENLMSEGALKNEHTPPCSTKPSTSTSRTARPTPCT